MKERHYCTIVKLFLNSFCWQKWVRSFDKIGFKSRKGKGKRLWARIENVLSSVIIMLITGRILLKMKFQSANENRCNRTISVFTLSVKNMLKSTISDDQFVNLENFRFALFKRELLCCRHLNGLGLFEHYQVHLA